MVLNWLKIYQVFTKNLKSLYFIQGFYKDISDDVEKRFDTSNYGVNRPLPTEKKR